MLDYSRMPGGHRWSVLGHNMWTRYGFENDEEGYQFLDWYSNLSGDKPDVPKLMADPIALSPYLAKFRKPRYMQEGMTYADLAAPTRAGYEGLSQMYKRGAMMTDPNLFGTMYQNRASNLFNEDKLSYRSWLDKYLDENINDAHLRAGKHSWATYLQSSRG